jgi:hypothetical protein
MENNQLSRLADHLFISPTLFCRLLKRVMIPQLMVRVYPFWYPDDATKELLISSFIISYPEMQILHEGPRRRQV